MPHTHPTPSDPRPLVGWSLQMVEDVCRSIGGSMLPAGSSLASLPRSKASSGVSDTALGNGTSGSPDRGAFAESTVHGASFAFTFCDRGPAHRRRPSGAGGNGHHGGRSRLGLADVDLSRAESTADLQIFDWSRYAHGSNSGDRCGAARQRGSGRGCLVLCSVQKCHVGFHWLIGHGVRHGL